MTLGSLLNRERHSSCESTATAGAPSMASPGSMVRPSAARAPSAWNMLSDTRPPVTLIGSPPSATSPIIHPGEIAAMCSKLRVRVRQ